MSTSRIAALVALLALGACKKGFLDLPAGPQELVIHGVLNPADTMQIVLIERTLTGTVTTPIVVPYTSDEPVYSDYGIAERHATTEITAPDGTVTIGTELPDCYQVPPLLCRGNGGGVYKFFLRGSSLVPGGVYKFRAVTTQGEIIEAETTIPETPLNPATTPLAFNRATDTLALAWSASPRAPAYQVRVENPYGAWKSFTDSTRVALTGGLRNPDVARLPHVFLPGYTQRISVTALDANLYDYYRTQNNSFIGYGSVSRVQGALGVFGSAVNVVSRNVSVTSTVTQPIEGVYDGIDTGLGYVYFTRLISVFIESPSTRKSDPDAITGYYSAPNLGTVMTGTHKDGKLKLAFLRNQTSFDTAEVFTGELRGDTLVGSYRQGAPGKFVKRP